MTPCFQLCRPPPQSARSARPQPIRNPTYTPRRTPTRSNTARPEQLPEGNEDKMSEHATANHAAGTPVLEVRDLYVDFGVNKGMGPGRRGAQLPGACGRGARSSGSPVRKVRQLHGAAGAAALQLARARPGPARRQAPAGPEPGQAAPGARQRRRRDLPGADDGPKSVYTVGAQIVETLRLHNPIAPAAAERRALEQYLN